MFRRRPSDPDTTLLPYRRILVPLAGAEADDDALRLTAMLLTEAGAGREDEAEVVLVHVIEVGFERTLDTEDEQRDGLRRRGARPRRGRSSRRGRSRTGWA